jgi:protein TonB
VNDRYLISSFGVSLAIHLSLLPFVSLLIQTRPSIPIAVPIDLVEVSRVEDKKQADVAPPPPTPAAQSKVQKVTAPKLLSKPAIFETPPHHAPGNIKEETQEPEKPLEKVSPLALPPEPGSVKGGWNPGSKAGEAEGSAAGAGNLFDKGNVGVIGGSGLEGGGGGQGISGLGRGAKGDGAGGGGVGLSESLSGLARPLGGYQVKPRYPESARRAGAQGITLLKLRILENGKVGEVQIEKSAGHAELDRAAADAVKKWLFEPARMGKIAVAVWVLLPVKFELE